MSIVRRRAKYCVLFGALAVIVAGLATHAAAQGPDVLPLSSVPVPRPQNLGDYVSNERAAIVLGKALFWDMQVGSDGVQACGTCHFRAGADPRKKNQVSPGLLRVKFKDGDAVPHADTSFKGQGPNYTLGAKDFPFKRFEDPKNRDSKVIWDSNNVVSSQGVHHDIFDQPGLPAADAEGFRIGQANVRRVEPRNTPTMINAVFNHRNFWDMRAQDVFNGVSPFGDRDAHAFVYRADHPSNPRKFKVRLENSSLASQAVGPPTNRFEMSADGRTFPDVAESLTKELKRRHRDNARRLRNLRPLGKQLVHPEDSVLGPYSRWPGRGLTVDYESLVRRAFKRQWWDSSKMIRVAENGTPTVVSRRDGDPDTNEFSLLEYNFSLFFGLAVQLYEATLVSDETPFDRFLKDGVPLSPAADRGRQVFFNVNQGPTDPRGGCRFCHSGSLLSEASVEELLANKTPDNPTGMLRDDDGQLSDFGTRNIGVTATTDDLGNGGSDPWNASLSVAVRDSKQGTIVAADGTFKVPSLRNVELTAPYFHNGGERTLLDVVKFYARGGNHGGEKSPILTRNGVRIDGLNPVNFLNFPNAEAIMKDLVEFLESLTDERVRRAAAPFDHPQIFVPNGHPGTTTSVSQRDGLAVDSFIEIPATGRRGSRVLLPGFLED
jgi:cytochrome c peroxidase